MVDYVNVERKTPRQQMRAKLIAREQELKRDFRPFDFANAWRDYNELVDKFATQAGNPLGSDAVSVSDFDIEKYGDSKRFELVKTTEVMENKLVDGSKLQVHTGYYEDYKVKSRGNYISVQVPKDVWESRKKKA